MKGAKCLRELNVSESANHFVNNYSICTLIEDLKELRKLHMRWCDSITMPKNIAAFVHLIWIDMAGTDPKCIPDLKKQNLDLIVLS